MSGPIIRKYGFPNFEDIFGKEEMKHGVEEEKAEGSVDVKAEKKGSGSGAGSGAGAKKKGKK